VAKRMAKAASKLSSPAAVLAAVPVATTNNGQA
jgi:hypothetical protein